MTAEFLEARQSELMAEVSALKAEMAVRDTRNAELEAIVVMLKTQVEELAEKLRRNSSNSHLPPSSDGPGAASRGNVRGKKSASGRKRGGQKGHRGAHRSLLPIERVDGIVELFPAACEGCSVALPETPDVDARRYARGPPASGSSSRWFDDEPHAPEDDATPPTDVE